MTKGWPLRQPFFCATLSEALTETGPAVVEVVVDPDALIMPPRIDASQAYHFGLAKLRELLGQ